APLTGAVKSVPSSWYELSVTLLPNACDRELVEVCGLTPAAWLIRSKNVNRRCGAFSTQLRLRLVATCVDAAFTTGDSPTTVTVPTIVPMVSWAMTGALTPITKTQRPARTRRISTLLRRNNYKFREVGRIYAPPEAVSSYTPCAWDENLSLANTATSG